MKRKLMMMALTAVLLVGGVLAIENKAYAYTQDELAEIWRAKGSLRQTTGGRGQAAPGYEYGGEHNPLENLAPLPGESSGGNSGSAASNGTSSAAPAEMAPAQPTHTHSYEEKVTREATCVEEGEKTFTCSCGKTYTEAIPKIEHSYTETITKEATCEAEGEKTFTCFCGDSYTEVIPKVEHEKGAVKTTKEATCTEAGERNTYCKYCGITLETEVVEAHGHTRGEMTVEKEATMFTKGLKTVRCVDCNEVLESEEIPIPLMPWYIVGGVATVALLALAGVVVVKKKRK